MPQCTNYRKARRGIRRRLESCSAVDVQKCADDYEILTNCAVVTPTIGAAAFLLCFVRAKLLVASFSVAILLTISV